MASRAEAMRQATMIHGTHAEREHQAWEDRRIKDCWRDLAIAVLVTLGGALWLGLDSHPRKYIALLPVIGGGVMIFANCIKPCDPDGDWE